VPRVRVVAVERLEMDQVLETTSTLESEREIQVFPRMAGVVVEVLAEEGDDVEAGQVLARLDDRDQALAVSDAKVGLEDAKNAAQRADLAVLEAEKRVESAQLAADQAERDHERNLELFQGGGEDQKGRVGLVSQQALEASRLARDNAKYDHEQAKITLSRSKLEAEASKTAVERAQVALQRAQLALDHTRILAPFAGAIAQRKVRLGDTVGAAQAAFVLTDLRALRAIFYRPQEELELFARRAGDTDAESTRLAFTATAEAFPGREFGGQIQRISPTIDAQSGQFRVTARIGSEDGVARLLPGMLVRMHIVTDRHPEALVVPKRALRREGERRFVLVLEPIAAKGPVATSEPDPASTAPAKPAPSASLAGAVDAGTPSPAPSSDAATHTVHRVDVTEGYADDDDIEVEPVKEGTLPPGKLVVLVGSRDLADGDAVRIDQGDAPLVPGGGEVAEAPAAGE